MNHNAYIGIGDILLDTTRELGDSKFRYGRPFHMTTIKRGLRQMALETGFDVRQWDGDVPSNRIMDVPTGMLGMGNNAWLYSGTVCDVGRAPTLFIKPHMFHKGGEGWFANTQWRSVDGLSANLGNTCNPPSNLYFAGYTKGRLYMSETCLQFTKLHITYNGLGSESWCDMDDDIEIPQWAAEAVKDWAVRAGAQVMRKSDPKYYTLIINEKERELKSNSGSWIMAKVAYSQMDGKDRADMAAYMGRYGHVR